MIESGLDIRRMSLQTGQQTTFRNAVPIPKDAAIMRVLDGMEYISPTSVNRYMRCPLQFYYSNVARINEPEDDKLEEMSSRIFGNVFHAASEILYGELRQDDGTVTREGIDYALKHKEYVARIVDRAFSETVFEKGTKKRIDYNGLQLINREVIIRYLRRLLEIDRDLAPFRINDVEVSVYAPLQVATSSGTRLINIGGRIDRLDRIYDKAMGCERLRVIDYKTGRYAMKKVNGIDDIFAMPPEQSKHTDYYLQTMLYAMLVRHDARLNPGGLAVSPALLFIQQTAADGYDPTLTIGKERITDIAEHEQAFAEGLHTVVSAIFDPARPFRPTDDRSACSFCPYSGLCGL